MGYIEKIRQLVGTTALILSSAGVILTDEKARILLSYRTDTNDWGLPGGYMELGETVEQTAIRELQEELDIFVRHLELFNIFSGPEFYHEYPNGDMVYSVIVIFLASDYYGKINIGDEEIQAFKFFDLNSLPSKLTKTTKKIIEIYSDVNKK